MKYFINMPILKKIVWIFSTMIGLMLIIGGTGVYTSHKLSEVTGLTVNSNDIIIISVTIIGVIYAAIMTIILKKSFVEPLRKIKRFAESLSNYDFSSVIEESREDEFGEAIRALNKAQNNVSKMIREITGTIEGISSSAEELSATAEEITTKAETIDEEVDNIASYMQETSATTEEISASAEEVDANINELSSKAANGSNQASESKERATEVKKSSENAIEKTRSLYNDKQKNMMKAIEDGKVVDSIKVMADTIGSIAERTNLLALNAAIEAASAGEQGRGFAVVAEEIRKLAEQSSEAVISIQETIEKVQEAFKSSVDTGSDILEFINTQVNKQFDSYSKTGEQYYNDSDFVSKMTEEIACMTEEVTAAVGQVNEAVQNMAQTSQKSTERVETIKLSIDETTKAIEQVALTAQSQAELSQKLNEMIWEFKI
ncbi:methyl-accepting chemotaxis protein [Clostridium sp. Sa3CVN1]|uniref:Methyl-accepting chemotaxis protein n=1 Tax=Clostridium cibarium TaxID=2762247 RepID=A0ABR8PQZ2_9CLOT|nr:methyl-accepting chemotaxis protein [Clostridium cibarium]